MFAVGFDLNLLQFSVLKKIVKEIFNNIFISCVYFPIHCEVIPPLKVKIVEMKLLVVP